MGCNVRVNGRWAKSADRSFNGFGLITRVVSLSSRNTQALEAFAYYALCNTLYFNFIAKGHDTTFLRDS